MSEFVKIHGAGNDFIIADDQHLKWPRHPDFIRKICDRQRGIGADGLILLSAPSASQAQVKMSFFNNDGLPAEMCGNGLRCAALFAGKYLDKTGEITFETQAGLLKTRIIDSGQVEIEIPVLKVPEKVEVDGKEGFFVNTGVPHLVFTCQDPENIDIDILGCEFRNHPKFQPEGTNVNFVGLAQEGLPVKIRTYERGVEGETAACGTGIAATALALVAFAGKALPLRFITRDGDILSVNNGAEKKLETGCKVLLTGPAEESFQGKIK